MDKLKMKSFINKNLSKYSDMSVGDVIDFMKKIEVPDNTTEEDKDIVPNYDIINEKERMIILVEIPGVKLNTLKVTFNNNIIKIKGNKERLFKKNLVKNEIKYGKFERKIILPIIIHNENDVKTDVKQGILSIIINKKTITDKTFTINF
tara:strand:- start:972 stop:1418 length:447 start_codon:yes stop_codon:yes gene_type:complete